jgi:glycerate 2-kinase
LTDNLNLRQTVLDIYSRTMHKLCIEDVMSKNIRLTQKTLNVWDSVFDLRAFDNILLLAIGKAAAPMANCLMGVLSSDAEATKKLEGLVVSPSVPVTAKMGLTYLTAAHPIPDESSRAAAIAVMEVLSRSDSKTLVFFLISGGSSAMLEMPIAPSLTDDEVASFNRVLVHSGLPIKAMNTLRKHISAIKGGRLAVLAGQSTHCTLLISDVPSGMLDVVGSGPTLPDRSTVEECREILRIHSDVLPLSPQIRSILEREDLPETPKWDHPAFERSACQVVLSSDDLCRNAAAIALEEGFHVEIDNTCDEWNSDEAAAYLLGKVTELRRNHERVCLLSAGELSVPMKRPHGRGGRNQHFVLECARRIAAGNNAITVLSAGSDGIDGNSPAAGAVADERTVRRAVAVGLDIETSLHSFDSFSIFELLGDALITGPSGNNVRDLRILCSIA